MSVITRTLRIRGTIEASSTQVRASKLALAVGFIAFWVAVVAAYNAPATAYELSIYAATPDQFWAGIATAVVLGLLVAWFVAPENGLRNLAIALVVGSILAVAALPIIRGYFFLGAGDSLTHLGWMKDIANGVLNPLNFLYPGIHTSTVFIERVTGMSLERATQFLVLSYLLVYVTFVGLTVRLIAKTKYALLFGLLSGLLVLPINNISVHLMAHPSTEGIFFLPLVLYATFRYLTKPAEPFRVWRLPITSSAVVLAVVLTAILLIHPQVTGNVILIFGSISFMQLAFRQLRSEHPLSQHRALFGHTIYLITIFLLWAPRNPRTTNTIDTLTNAILYGVSSGSAIAQRGSTLTELGGSLPELFFKLFLLSLAFGILSGMVMLLSLGRKFAREYPVGDGIVKYLTISMVPLFGMFLLFSILQGSTQRFRYIGFVMVLLTILGAVMLSWGFDWLSQRTTGTRVLRAGVVIAFLLMLPLSTMTIFSSPFIYQPTQHVSEATFNGYETAFEYQDSSIPFTGIHSGPSRYVHAIYGSPFTNEEEIVPGAKAEVPNAGFAVGNLTTYYSSDRYIIYSDSTEQRELELYEGLRYPAVGFTALETTSRIDQVHSNGEVRVYLLHPNTAPNVTENSTVTT
ncbi:hypothetical protein [Haladaptatus sp. DJG-WS-42]|uniref:hypothetical protein n=1 Tax=Haladaptatus sp. DJG-WS-42 TaxID=3120516 RepID=UPI0030CBBA7C